MATFGRLNRYSPFILYVHYAEITVLSLQFTAHAHISLLRTVSAPSFPFPSLALDLSKSIGFELVSGGGHGPDNNRPGPPLN
jgi:hypothetical protein